MACWVVPAIAAELWGVTVNHVLAGVRDGSIESRHEHGFVFVDAAPGSYTYQRPRRPGEPRLPTFVPVQPDEGAAPASEGDSEGDSEAPADQPSEETVIALAPVAEAEDAELAPLDLEAEDAELPPLDLEEDDTPLPPRDAIRSAVARQRRRPLAA